MNSSGGNKQKKYIPEFNHKGSKTVNNQSITYIY